MGVHTPETWWEKSYKRVVAATKELGVAYPVVQDNDFVIWHRYSNRAWPAAVIVDKKGIVRFTHIGEGGYAEMEQLIRALLVEPSSETRRPDPQSGGAPTLPSR